MSDDLVLSAIEKRREPPDPLTLAGYPTHDLGLAERLRKRFGDRLAKTPEEGWAAWNGKVWAIGSEGEAQARRYAHETASAMWDEYSAAKAAMEAAKAGGEEAKGWNVEKLKFLGKAAGSAGDSSKTNAMLAQAAPYLQAKLKTFDPDPFRVCCENGTLTLTMIKAPCFVAREDGVVTGHVKGADIEALDAGGGVRVGDWQLARGRQGEIEVLAPGGEAGDEKFLQLADMKQADLVAGVHTLTYAPYHQAARLVPHNPEHRITRIAGVAYDAKATCTKWLAHMATVLPHKEDRDWFQRAMGYALCGSTDSQCFLILQNKGGSGTSTTMETIGRVIGTYGKTCDPATFLESSSMRSAADASPDRAALAGDTRLVYCEEPKRGAKFNTSLIKQICGGGTSVMARELHEGLFDFDPHFLFVIACNRMVRVPEDDDGFWRRVRLIRFTRQFTREEQLASGDKVGELSAEGPGILNWLLEGLAAWRHEGLMPTEKMDADILNYRSTSNPFGEWFRDWIAPARPSDRVKNSVLFAAYKAYCDQEGLDARYETLGPRQFANALDDLQIPIRKVHGERYRFGIRMRAEDEVRGPLLEDDGDAS